MKTFRFRLERVLELRNSQLKQEEGKLAQLLKLREAKQERFRNQETALANASAAQGSRSVLHASELLAWTSFSQHVHRQLAQLQLEMDADTQRIGTQRAAVLAARSRVRLLEKLKDRRRAEWQAEADRELETAASEFSSSQWLRESRDRLREINR